MTFWLILGIIFGVLLTYALTYIRRNKMFAGNIVLSETEEGKKIFSLEIERDPDEIWVADVISFKVVRPEASSDIRE